MASSRRVHAICAHLAPHSVDQAAEGVCPHLATHGTAGDNKLLEDVRGKMTRVTRKGGFWIVHGFNTAKALLESTDYATSGRAGLLDPPNAEAAEKYGSTLAFFDSWILMNDPPVHTKYRAMFFKFLTQKKLSHLEEVAVRATNELLDAAEKKGGMEVIRDFSSVLPVIVTASLIGVDVKKDLAKLKHWAHAFADIITRRHTPTERLQLAYPEVQTSMAYAAELLAHYRAHREPAGPTRNFVSDLIDEIDAQRAKGQDISDHDICANIVLLIFASADTLQLTIPNSVVALLTHPDQLAWLRKHPHALKDSAVEELLRYCGPGGITARSITADVEVNQEGLVMKKGDIVLLDIHEINRDPEVFTEPNILNLQRDPKKNQHLSFGAGRHMCLGRNLARIELRVAIEAIVMRFPRLRLAHPYHELEWGDSLSVAGWKAVPVLF